MASFLIKKIEIEQDMININHNIDGYVFKPNLNVIEIKTITLYNKKMISSILTSKLEKKFERLAMITYDVLTSDDEDSQADTAIALDEIAKLKSIINKKYDKYISKKLKSDYLKKIFILEKELNSKILIQRTHYDYLQEEKKSPSR